MIHSKDENPSEILEFSKEYEAISKLLGIRKPLISVPTTYNMLSTLELEKYGFNIIIYANHLLRASHRVMKKAAEMILKYGRSFEVESICTPIKEIFNEVGLTFISDKDRLYQKQGIQVVIPAAGFDDNFNIPKAMVKIKGKSILQRQVDILKKHNLNKITVIKGFKKEYFDVKGVKYIDNNDYNRYYIVHSLFLAEEDFQDGFLYINSDVLFTESLIYKIINTHYDIVLVVDKTYQYHKHEIDKKLDLILTKNKPNNHVWQLYDDENEVIRIGKNIKLEMADFEYIGIAYFSKFGAEILRKVHYDCRKNWKGKFHEAEDYSQADFMDLIQEIINRGFKVNIIEIHKGWIEINNQKDVQSAELMI